ncbi:MFS transporter [Paenibacillus dokdonensis]|uniref:MFS transporter n=1 Tax=Paenibacillus dokdonensis TaxID=2567944 RepID=A0ABU6GIY2_9BACL|nr:MFS transporter [Paenibacillus dokdonensis]MEC0239168.1 MFS transporter [Paenibacillus dokdonensis]
MLSAASLLLIPSDRPMNASSPSARTPLIQDMKDGLYYMANRRTLLLLSLSFFAVGLGVGVISPLGIFVVTQKLGLPAGELKWLSIPYGIGEIIGGMITFGLASRMSPRTLLLLGLGVNATGIIVTGVSDALWLTMLAQFVIALLQPAIFIGNNALVMKHTDAEYIGRVTGIRIPLMTGAMLIMMSLSGVLKDLLSLEWAYTLSGLFLLAGLLIVLPVERFSRKTSEPNEPA